jgi:hypothetical protein
MEWPTIGGLKSVINLELLYPINKRAAIIQQLKTSLCRLPEILMRLIFNLYGQFPLSDPGV